MKAKRGRKRQLEIGVDQLTPEQKKDLTPPQIRQLVDALNKIRNIFRDDAVPNEKTRNDEYAGHTEETALALTYDDAIPFVLDHHMDAKIMKTQYILGSNIMMGYMSRVADNWYSPDFEVPILDKNFVISEYPAPNRLFFDDTRGGPHTESGHFVVLKAGFGGKQFDSYGLGFQISQTNGLCMVFAAMICAEMTQDLVRATTMSKGQEVRPPVGDSRMRHNTQVALQFAIDRIGQVLINPPPGIELDLKKKDHVLTKDPNKPKVPFTLTEFMNDLQQIVGNPRAVYALTEQIYMWNSPDDGEILNSDYWERRAEEVAKSSKSKSDIKRCLDNMAYYRNRGDFDNDFVVILRKGEIEPWFDDRQ